MSEPRAVLRRWLVLSAAAQAVVLHGAVLAATPLAGAACRKLTASAKPLELKLLGSDSVLFKASEARAEIALPLQLPLELDAQRVRVRLLQVRRDKLLDKPMEQRFRVVPSLVDAQRKTPAIGMTIEDIPQLRPGAYQVMLAFDHYCGVTLAPLSLPLERPAAQLQPTGRLNVDVVLPIGFGLAAGSPVPTTLRLSWADDLHLSALRAVKLQELPFRTGTGRAAAGTLGATAASAPAGVPLVLTLTPRNLEVGFTQAQLELHSPDLKTPVTLDIDIRTRLWRPWILAFVLLGIGLGFLLRVVLQGRIEMAQARMAGEAVFQALWSAVKDVADAELHAAIRPRLDALAQALAGSTSAIDITALRVEAKKAVDDAVAALNTRLDQVAALLTALRRMPAGTGRLPKSMQAAVGALAEPCNQAAALLASQDAAGAKALLDGARLALVQALTGEWASWQVPTRALDADVSLLRNLLDPERHVGRGLDGPDTRFAAAAYAQAEVATSVADFDALDQVERGLHAWRALDSARVQMLWLWSEYLRADCDRFEQCLLQRLAPKKLLPAEREAWRAATTAAVQALQDAAGAPDAFTPVRPCAQEALQATETLLRAVCASRSDLGDGARQVMATAIGERRFFEALSGLPETPPNEKLAEGAAGPTAGERPAGSAEPSSTTVNVKHDGAPKPATIDTVTLRRLAARTARELARAQMLQTGIVAVVMLGVSYVFFESSFLGTPTELLGLFFWGFTADISMAGLLGLSGGLASKPKV
jgi:hypothetical protein